ncbi:DUF4123 domain-containing protein [Motilimonas pumila]|nr:DUF4123 domain-containing protein [Motilimonas pumila]
MKHLIERINQSAHYHQYIVLNSTSDAEPLRCYFSHSAAEVMPIWAGTEYANWKDAMPYIAPLPDDSFFEEMAQQQNDWGLVVSTPLSISEAKKHLCSISQIWLPTGKHVFFRFFDPDASFGILNQLSDQEKSQLMGPFAAWHSQLEQVTNPAMTDQASEKAFPWFEISKASLTRFQEKDSRTLEVNTLKWLKEQHADLFFAFPPAIITAKVNRLTRKYGQTPELNKRLIESLTREVYR